MPCSSVSVILGVPVSGSLSHMATIEVPGCMAAKTIPRNQLNDIGRVWTRRKEDVLAF